MPVGRRDSFTHCACKGMSIRNRLEKHGEIPYEELLAYVEVGHEMEEMISWMLMHMSNMREYIQSHYGYDKGGYHPK